MNVAVLGCGPAGLMACHAAVSTGNEVDVFSYPREPSKISGAQYLHQHIPVITSIEPEGRVSYVKLGTAGGYAQKVYGSPFAPTSWTEFRTGEHPCWSLKKAYDRLWRMYLGKIKSRLVLPEDVASLCVDYDKVLSTVPAPALCQDPGHHAFEKVDVVLASGSPVNLQNTIVYSGRELEEWYRTSVIFGYGWTEYAGAEDLHRVRPVIAVAGIKPLYTDCDCHLDSNKFSRLGRFGQWRKQVLTSDAFVDALKVLQ